MFRPWFAVLLCACAGAPDLDLPGVPAETVLGADADVGVGSLRAPLLLTLDGAVVPGQTARWTVSGAAPGETINGLFSLAGTGNGPCPPVLGGQCLGILAPVVLFDTDTADATGVAELQINVPANAPVGADLSVQAVAIRGAGGVLSVATDALTFFVQDIVIDDFVHFPAAADLLFVVDDSCSMADEQGALSISFEPMIDTILDLGLDYHVGVVSTDMDAASKSGKLQPDAGGGLFITPSDPNPAATFDEMAALGTSGSGTEKGLSAVFASIDTLGATANLGFRRATAQLAVVVLSDEEDQSGLNVNDFVTWVEDQAFNPGDVTFSSIVEPAGGCPGGTSPGLRYIDVTTQVGGIFARICAADYSGSLTTLAETLWTSVPYELSEVADPATIVITADEVTGTVTLDTADWVYDPVENTVRFTSSYHPPSGTDLHVTYEAL